MNIFCECLCVCYLTLLVKYKNHLGVVDSPLDHRGLTSVLKKSGSQAKLFNVKSLPSSLLARDPM